MHLGQHIDLLLADKTAECLIPHHTHTLRGLSLSLRASAAQRGESTLSHAIIGPKWKDYGFRIELSALLR